MASRHPTGSNRWRSFERRVTNLLSGTKLAPMEGNATLPIYLDNMAATPLDPRVAETHRSISLSVIGNPQSRENSSGDDAGRELDRATECIRKSADLTHAAVVFTPGASAGLWLAVEGAVLAAGDKGLRIIAGKAEHPALLSAVRRAHGSGRAQTVELPVTMTAELDLQALEEALKEGPAFVCAMAVNNEVGTISDLAAIADLTRRYGARLLVDASQAFGKVPAALLKEADLLVVSGAKIYGPHRSGALIGTVDGVTRQLAHDVFGTPDVAAAAALAHAMRLRVSEAAGDEARIRDLRDRLEGGLLVNIEGLRVNGDPERRVAGCLHVSTPHAGGEAAVARLWGRVSLSTGAACQTGVPGPSHVLTAMGLPQWASDGAVRIGIGRFNTEAEIEQASAMLIDVLGGVSEKRRRA